VVDEDGDTLPDAPDTDVVGLSAGVGYVRGWADADRAAELLRAELDAWGIGRRMCVRARVSAAGAGVVELGCVGPELAELLAELLGQARTGVPGCGGQRPEAA
jgi:hypothetical protein